VILLASFCWTKNDSPVSYNHGHRRRKRQDASACCLLVRSRFLLLLVRYLKPTEFPSCQRQWGWCARANRLHDVHEDCCIPSKFAY
jgi:hypothetical protein